MRQLAGRSACSMATEEAPKVVGGALARTNRKWPQVNTSNRLYSSGEAREPVIRDPAPNHNATSAKVLHVEGGGGRQEVAPRKH